MPVAAFVIALAFTITRAEASGDAYGDSAVPTGGIAGTLDNVLHDPDGTFVQIGTADSAGAGSVTVNFDNNVAFNGPGADIRIYIVDDTDPATGTVEVSADGVTWVTVGDFEDTANIDIDLETLTNPETLTTPLPFAVAVRITQVSGTLPGFDLDAVEALNEVDLEDAVLAATPETDENPGFTSHTVTATLTELDAPVEGVEVSFLVVSGPNAGDSDTDTTAADGTATYSYDDDGGAGTDVIRAWLDINGNGDLDAGEPSDLVTKTWNGVTGTIELNDVDGGGVAVDDTLEVVVDDRDLDIDTNVADTVQVVVTSTSDGVGLTALTLTETGPSTGVFTGTLTLAGATDPVARTLLATYDDTITASYDDALDDAGVDPLPVTDSLTVLGVDQLESVTADNDKITLCHVPPGNPGNQHTISVGASALDAHLAHGDSEGACDEERPGKSGLNLLGDDDASDDDANLQSFCERKPDHKRCLEASSESSQSATTESDDEESVGAADDGSSRAQLEAFCERKPDHKRCLELNSGEANQED